MRRHGRVAAEQPVLAELVQVAGLRRRLGRQRRRVVGWTLGGLESLHECVEVRDRVVVVARAIEVRQPA
jgi:hypothetical protein